MIYETVDSWPRERRVARLLGIGTAVATAPAVVAAAPFWAVASLTRRLPHSLRLEPRGVATWQDLMRYVPEVGWQTKPCQDAHLNADGVFHLTTDDEGWRGSLPLDAADVVVFGDSYAFGTGVDDDEMYTEHAGDLKVKALGSNGYSMVHSVIWMKRLADRIAGRHVVWMVYLGNDLFDNLQPNYAHYRMPFVRSRQGQWEITSHHVSQAPWPIVVPTYPPEELSRICTEGLVSDRALDAAGYLIGVAKRLCDDIGSDLTVMSVPSRMQIDPKLLPKLKKYSPDPSTFDAGRPDRALSGHSAASGCHFIPLARHLSPEDYQVRDIHWRPRGHRKVGQLIAGAVRHPLAPPG